MKLKFKHSLVWIFIFAGLFAFLQIFPDTSKRHSSSVIPYSDFIKKVDQGKISEVTLRGQIIAGLTKDGKVFTSYSPEHAHFVPHLLEKNIKINAIPFEQEASFFQAILPWLPIILLLGLTFYSFRQIQSGGNKALGFGRSRARLLTDKSKVTFKDVAGIEEAKEELQEIVDFLKDAKKFQRLGGRIPKGVLLVGSPGTGKTLLAKAIAGEADVPFYSISGSDFVEMFVGVGASRVRDMFEQAKKNAPCIVFIDEIDAVGRHRGIGLGGGNDEREQTLNQMLVEMDGFEENSGIIIIAATNRPDILDPALLRPGRFDRQVVVAAPDVAGREQILTVHMKKIPLGPDVNTKILAKGTPGFSGADLANLVNEAALAAARKNKLTVTMSDFEEAKDKVMMGAERRSLIMTDDEKSLTAHHEAGHAIVSLYEKLSDPIHKATIIPRGRALGMVIRIPEGDRLSVPKAKLLADIRIAMGGRIAEELIFGPDMITTGASSDIQMATEIVRRMVVDWGMADKLGFLSYGQEDRHHGGRSFSEETCRVIDDEIRKIMDVCFKETKDLLLKHLDQLKKLAEALLERETLTGEEIRYLMDHGELPAFIEEVTVEQNSSVPCEP